MTTPSHDTALAAMLADLTRTAGLPAPTRPLTAEELVDRLADDRKEPAHDRP
jgi:hypothetical protein